MLINPYPIESWTDWDPSAQAETGISRKLLRKEGHHPKEVAIALNNDLKGRDVYSDAPDFDEGWLRILFDAVGVKMEFVVVHIWKAFQSHGSEEQMWSRIDNAEKQLTNEGKQMHRAAADVERSLLAWQMMHKL